MERRWQEQLAKEIGRRVKALRQSAGLSQERTAREMDMSRQTVFEIERGTRLADWATYGRIADALGVSITAVLPLDRALLEYLSPQPAAHSRVNRSFARKFSRKPISTAEAA